MPTNSRRFLAAAALLVLPALLPAQSPQMGRGARGLIAGPINDGRLRVLPGNTRPEAIPANDRGRVEDSLALDHMQLQMQRSPEQEQAVDEFVESLQTPGSPNFHQWPTAAEFGERFGASQADLDIVTRWLQSHGFTVNSVAPGGMTVDFSGTAGQVAAAFHTEIHYLSVNGKTHVANVSDPGIPEALAAAVSGIVSLHDFTPHAMSRPHPAYTYTSSGSTYQAVVPADLATIYNLNPLFSAGVSGQGQTIAVVEDTNLYSSNDWTTFRTEFGLSKYTSGSLTTIHPGNCGNPGVPKGGDDGEAILDAEWASAAAPSAAIQVASCANTRTTFGGLIAIQNMINGANPPQVISMSYGECEAENGAAANAAYNSAFQQAAAEGVSVYVSAGDEGAASCDAGASGATHGVGISAFASTPYNVAAGGTDFGDTFAGSNATYWNTANSPAYGSAKSYIPEIPWNDSCAGQLLASYLGYSTTYGASGFCNSSTASSDGLQLVVAGSGGPSGCATGSPSTSGVVSGACKGYAKPAWQTGMTPSDGVRDIPDISLFAANGIWGHYYVYCWTDIREGGAACTGAPSGWAGAGGTSFSSPILAGIQALIDQHKAGRQGNPNPRLYALASAGTCNSSLGSAAPSSCVFYNVTQGDNDVNCGGSVQCYGSTTTTSGGRHPTTVQRLDGALSTSSKSYSPAYPTGAGWNFATGIGSVNAYNLVMHW
ncbi:MAG TPA: S53 family peptidase [Bryobacteraceae bacterium]|nr:S53 family peptidase [Bryobacteraceae bacterium]